MSDPGLLAQAVAAIKPLGLNYAFLLDLGERQAFLDRKSVV